MKSQTQQGFERAKTGREMPGAEDKACDFIKKQAPAKVFSCDYCEY